MAVLAIDGDLAKGEKSLHLAARFTPLWQLGYPVAITGQRADQVCSQAIDDAEVMADGEAVVHHLPGLFRHVELLVDELAREAVEKNLVSHAPPLPCRPPG